MIRLIVITILFASIGISSSFIFAQDSDNKIIISNKEEVYTYISDKKGVQVRAEYTTNYKCLKPGQASVTEFYDNYSEIKNVKIKGIKGVSPQYGMFKQENIFFSDAKACYFNLPFIEKGSEATVTLSKIYKDVRRFSFLALAEPYYISSKTIKIIVPDWMKVDLRLQNSSGNIKEEPIRDEAKKTTTYIYYINNQQEYIVEPNSPDYGHSYPYITIIPKESDFGGKIVKYLETADDLYQWYKEPIMLLNNDEKTIKEKSLELTTGCSSDIDKIRKLCGWVQQNIRYIAFMDGIAAFKPDDAQEVMAKKYGDCKGMSNLLKALLTSAGFDARLTWVATRADSGRDLDVNAPTLFADHMICSLFWNDSLFFIDPTVRSLSFREIPEYIQGQNTLIEDGDKYIVSRIPEYSSENNKDSLYIKCLIAGNGLLEDGCRYFNGEAKHTISYWMNSLKETDKKRMLENFLKNGEPQDSISDIRTVGLDSFLPKIYINYTANRKSNINTFGNQIYVNLDVCKDYQNKKIDILKRKTSMKIPYKEHIVRVSELSIPDTYTVVQLPQKIEIVRKKYSFILSYKQDGNKIIYEKEISIFDPVLDKGDFEQWNSDIDTLRKAYNELAVLETK